MYSSLDIQIAYRHRTQSIFCFYSSAFNEPHFLPDTFEENISWTQTISEVEIVV